MSYRKSLSMIVVFILFLVCQVYSQNPEWIVYNTSNSGLPGDEVHCITIDALGNKWVGTGHFGMYGTVGSGLAQFDGTKWTVYNSSNSGLPGSFVTSIVIDSNDNKWIGSCQFGFRIPYGAGLSQFDGTIWTVYDTSNSGLPCDIVHSIAIDDNDNKWIGTMTYTSGTGGMARFDGSNWTAYNTSDTNLPSDDVWCIVVDDSGNKWIGTYDGLAKFDGTNWAVYNTSNSDLPGNYINCIAIDGSDNKWIGTNMGMARFDGTIWTVYSSLPGSSVNSIVTDSRDIKWIGTDNGLVRFDGINWAVYDTSNSDLPYGMINCIAIDGSDNKWIGTGNGLAVFKEGGVVGIEVPLGINTNPKSQLPTHITLYPNYPNPFNPVTTIIYEIPLTSNIDLSIFNLLGQKVATLVSKQQPAGRYNVTWDATGYASGLYFYRLEAKGFSETKKLILMK